MSEIETRVTDMLERRAADVAPDPDEAWRPLPDPSAPILLLEADHAGAHRRSRPALALALVAGLAIGAAATGAMLLPGRDAGTTGAGSSDQVTPSSSTAVTSPGSAPVAVGSLLAEVVDGLPDGVDVDRDLIWVDRDAEDRWQAAASYLSVWLPDATITPSPTGGDGLEVVLEAVDAADGLQLFRWSMGDQGFPDGGAPAGWLIGRLADHGGAGVVAAVTDGVRIVDLERTADGQLRATLANDLQLADLYLDVTDIDGQPVEGSPQPQGPSGDGALRFGTSGSVDAGAEGSIELEVPLSAGVKLRAQHIGGTRLSITEVMVNQPDGFPASCGDEPPVTIDVGSLLGPLQPGPAPGSAEPLQTNQQAWHHPATPASLGTTIEIRWPPDPARLDVVDPSEPGDGTAVARDVHLDLVDDPGQPCDTVQVSVSGDPSTVDWWTTAVSGEWSFDYPLSVAELDPADHPDRAALPEDPGELIVGTVENVDPGDVPRVAATGSCDGLPDAPPRRGVDPPGAGHGTPVSALGAIVDPLSGADTDPRLPTSGYTEYRRTNSSWRVTAWEAAAC